MIDQSSSALGRSSACRDGGRRRPGGTGRDNIANLLIQAAERHPDRTALRFDGDGLNYAQFVETVRAAAGGLLRLGLEPGDRVGVYLEKGFEAVIALFATVAAGGAFVPINPLLKPRQVGYILQDCDVRILVTSAYRLEGLAEQLTAAPNLEAVVLTASDAKAGSTSLPFSALAWKDLVSSSEGKAIPQERNGDDLAAILYTSGSTGLPKGVMISHRNLSVGAKSVSSYLENDANDRILSVLPLSFDAGLSQLTTALYSGACCVLQNYLLPRDVVRICAAERITGITGVPPLWIQLAQLKWPRDASESLRYFANTGGHMPRVTLDRLRAIFPQAKPYLMYGLTEAFRSTYLDPTEVDRRPDSIGKAIPNAEILVVRADGSICDPDETGELVHCGPLVSLGYWNDPERTAERFRPRPGAAGDDVEAQIAVWSGDSVRMDEEGFLYFVGRRDSMIKTSGYRVSPTEVEEIAYASGLIGEAIALGIAHPVLGQAIVVVATPQVGENLDSEALLACYRRDLPGFMVPHRIIARDALPRNANGKLDREALALELSDIFSGAPV